MECLEMAAAILVVFALYILAYIAIDKAFER